MATTGLDEPSGRETRLLVLVVAVALAVLLLLSRFRFPAANLPAAPSSAPLAGLVARATFDEMSETMVDVFARASASTVVVGLEAVAREAPPVGEIRGRRATVPAPNMASPAPSNPPVLQFVPAVRARADLAVVYVPEGSRPVAAPGIDGPIEVVATDAGRHIALIRTAGRSGTDGLSGAVRVFSGFSYVAIVDATPTGPTVQPVFIGRADPMADLQWPQGLTALGHVPGLTAGNLLFSTDGHFIGIVSNTLAGLAIIPAPAIEAFVDGVAGVDRSRAQ